jgi:oxidoreductase
MSSEEEGLQMNPAKDQPLLKMVVIGASGASGREVVRNAAIDPAVGAIKIITRRILPEWESDPVISKKISIMKLDDYDNLISLQTELSSGHFDVFFCCLGTTQKQGKETFIKVDYTYCLRSAELAHQCQIPHFSVVSSGGTNPDSMFFYLKTKGEMERDIKKIGFEYCSVAKPGMLRNRENDSRCGEKFFCCFACCAPNIEIKTLGAALVIDAVRYWQLGRGAEGGKLNRGNVDLSNQGLKDIVKNYGG